MSQNSFFAKALRFIGIVLMALTAGFTLLGGVGTTCAALFPTNWDSMAPLATFQWLYILFVLTGIAIGIAGIRATVLLVKGAPKAYRDTLYALIAGIVIGSIHILVSRALRGKSMPVDAVVYTTVLTLVIFLLFRIPAIWQGVDFAHARSGGNLTGGAAAIVVGIFTFFIQYFMAPTHTWNGVNYADAFHVSMSITGAALMLGGLVLAWAPRKVKWLAIRPSGVNPVKQA
jgi:hypothetical protein